MKDKGIKDKGIKDSETRDERAESSPGPAGHPLALTNGLVLIYPLDFRL
jgi:hypothetical protein